MITKQNSRFLSKSYESNKNRLLKDIESMTEEETWLYDMDDMWKNAVNEDNFIMEYEISDGEGGTIKKKIDIRTLPYHG